LNRWKTKGVFYTRTAGEAKHFESLFADSSHHAACGQPDVK